MKPRIVLSLVAAGVFAAAAAFADPAPPPDDNGIGTSPSDVIVFVSGHTTCSDAIAIAGELWPGASAVFEIEEVWRAKVADPNPPAVAPAMMEWRAPALPIYTPLRAAFPLLAVLAIVVPLVQTVIAKIFAAQVKDANRRTEIAGYVDTAFHVVEQLGPQLGLSGAEKYNRFIEQVIDGLKAAGSPELSGKEMAQLQRQAAVKAMLAKTRAVLPRPPLPLPPPRG